MVSKRLATLVVAACVASGGSGCSVISLSSAPTAPILADHGDTLGEPFHQLTPSSPQPDWSAENIVDGMQVAMAAYDDEGDDKTLWKYFTGSARKAWKPGGSIFVLDRFNAVLDEGTKPDAPKAQVTITGNQIAEIKPDGRYLQLSDPLPVSNRVTLERVGEQGYRVAALDHPQLLLTAADVDRSYVDARLYYMSLDSSTTVADAVRIRRRPDRNLAESLVDRLLKGPSDALQKAVLNGMPQGQARVGSVRLSGDKVLVDLQGSFSPSQVSTQKMRGQLGATLKDLTNRRDIEVLHNNEPFFGTSPLLIRASDYNAAPTPSLEAYYLTGGQVYFQQEPTKEWTPFGSAVPHGVEARDLAVSPDGQRLAVWSAEGIWLQENGQWRNAVPLANLIAPVWRSDRTLWTYDSSRSLFLRYDPVQQTHQEIPAPALKGSSVTSFAFARDGVRVALIVKDIVGQQTLQVGAVTAGEVGNFQELDKTKDKDPQEFRDVVWESGEDLLLLTEAFIHRVNIVNGSTSEIQAKDALSIAVQGARILVGSEGEVLVNAGSQKLDTVDQAPAEEGVPTFPAFRA